MYPRCRLVNEQGQQCEECEQHVTSCSVKGKTFFGEAPKPKEDEVKTLTKALAQARFDLINMKHERDEALAALKATKSDLNAVMRKVLTGSTEFFNP